MYQLSVFQWLIVSLAAVMIGVSKTGIAGGGVLAIPLMAHVLPARASTGVVLPMLIFADLFAVTYYRRQASWPHLWRVIPPALAGICTGYLIMGVISDRQLQPFIGLVIITMLGLNWWRKRRAEDIRVPDRWWFSSGLGFLAGVTTMLANAAGPIMVIYLLSVKLPKLTFIGTAAWYFFILNWVKVPLSANLGLINPDSLRFNLLLLPLVTLGALAGIFILKKIPERVFTRVVELLATAAALKLLLTF